MNLEELRAKRTELLDAISEIECAHTSAAYSEELSSCPTCLEIRELGRHYESVQKQIRIAEGRGHVSVPDPTKYYAITDEMRATAKRNGISYHTLQRRVKRGWSPEVATTKAPVEYEIDPFLEIAKKNGISASAYNGRINLGWDKKVASTKPLRKKRKHSTDKRRDRNDGSGAFAGDKGRA